PASAGWNEARSPRSASGAGREPHSPREPQPVPLGLEAPQPLRAPLPRAQQVRVVRRRERPGPPHHRLPRCPHVRARPRPPARGREPPEPRGALPALPQPARRATPGPGPSTARGRRTTTVREPPVSLTLTDLFAGAGASLLAAHQLDRTGIAIELDPRYVGATLERAATLAIAPKKAGKA